MIKAVALLSSGLDSTVNLYKATKEKDVILAITFDYGQKAVAREIDSARKICQELHIQHKVIQLNFFKDFADKTSLVSRNLDIPQDVAIDDIVECRKTAKSVWVPNRNGIMINIASGFAEGLNAQEVIVGFNKEEATTFPDNSKEYLEKVSESLSYSTMNSVKVVCYTTDMNKKEIAHLGREMNVNFSNIWPCYHGGPKPCGKCESCLRYLRALA